MNQPGSASEIGLEVGEERVVELSSLAMAGYQWSALVSGPDPDAIAVQLRRGVLAAPAKPGMSAPEQAVLRGIRPGVARLRLRQRRPWERDEPAAAEIEFDVHARARPRPDA